jgi:hypothetical protein
MTTHLLTFMRERVRVDAQKSGEQDDETVSFQKIPDIEFLEDMEVGALLNE